MGRFPQPAPESMASGLEASQIGDPEAPLCHSGQPQAARGMVASSPGADGRAHHGAGRRVSGCSRARLPSSKPRVSGRRACRRCAPGDFRSFLAETQRGRDVFVGLPGGHQPGYRCTSGPYRGGRPGLRRSASPVMPPSMNRPRQARTVSSLSDSIRAITALGTPSAAASTIRARTTRRWGALLRTSPRRQRLPDRIVYQQADATGAAIVFLPRGRGRGVHRPRRRSLP